ncbi:MAG: metal-dependent hydrolase, partial [Erysipelotrichales bacterium]
MDTSSHVCMGVATGLLATSLAATQGIEVHGASVVAFSIVANVIPDIDVVLKLKSRDAYIANHRGMTHSFLFMIAWIVLLSAIAQFYYPTHSIVYFGIISIGVISHIVTDLLNGYGVQFLWPISHKWIAFGVTYTFDAIFLISNVIAFILIFAFKFNIKETIIITYVLFALYIFVSFIYQLHLRRHLIEKYGKYKRMILQAKATPINWKYVYETNDGQFYMGLVHKRDIIELRNETRQSIINKELENN